VFYVVIQRISERRSPFARDPEPAAPASDPGAGT
jgi:hypothetical protein